jgi:hypothetical protein
MGVVSIMLDAVGLMIGSLFCAGLLTFSAWWLAGRLHRPWTALVMLAVACGVMLVTPLEHSLFIRMVAVFAIVGTGLLYFIGDGEHAIGPHHDHPNR